MQTKKVVKTEPSIIQTYVSKIMANKNDPQAVQNIIIEAAKEGVLPQLHQIGSKLKVFEETDPEIIKVCIAGRLFEWQRSWVANEKLKQIYNVELKAIENEFVKHHHSLALTKVYTLSVLPNSRGNPKFPSDLLSIIPEDNCIVIFKRIDDITVVRKYKGELQIDGSLNPGLYQGLFFEHEYKLIDSKNITDEIYQDIQDILPASLYQLTPLQYQMLLSQLKKKKDLILNLKEVQQEIKDDQKNLLLEAIQHHYLPSVEHLDQYQPHLSVCDRYDKRTAEDVIPPEVKQETKKLILSFEPDNLPINSVRMFDVFFQLRYSNYSKFRKILKKNLCRILSRESEDEERRFLTKHLQYSNFRRVTLIQNEDNKFILNPDFSNADLSNSDFEHADFSNANFTCAIMREICFRNMGLVNANFTQADLEGADFTGTDLKGANFAQANLQCVRLVERRVENILIANFEPQQLLTASSIRGIQIQKQYLSGKYTLEDKKTLWEKLIQDYQVFFTTSHDAEEILKEMCCISLNTNANKKSTLYDLCELLNKNYEEICMPLLATAYKHVLPLIEQGALITKQTMDNVCNYNCYAASIKKSLFGKEAEQEYSYSILRAIEKNIPYYDFLLLINSLDKNLKKMGQSHQEAHDNNLEEINNILTSAFHKIFILFQNKHYKAVEAFQTLNACLINLYGEDHESYSSTLIHLFLNESIEFDSKNHLILFYFAETLFTAEGLLGFSNKKEKFQLIWLLLSDLESEQAQSLKKQVYNVLISNLKNPGINHSSLEKMVGVDLFLYDEDLKKLRNIDFTVIQAAKNYINNENSEVKESAKRILAHYANADVLLKTLRGKTVACYVQLVSDPYHPVIIRIALDAEEHTIITYFSQAFLFQSDYLKKIQAKRKKYLFALSQFIAQEFYESETNSIEGLTKASENVEDQHPEVQSQKIFNADFKPTLTLKSLINEKGNLFKINYLWYFIKNKRVNGLTVEQKFYFAFYTRINLISYKYMSYLNQAEEILFVLEKYVGILNINNDPNFKIIIFSILNELDALFINLDHLIVMNKKGIEASNDNYQQIANSLDHLNKAIDAAEKKLQEMHKHDSTFIAQLPSQKKKISDENDNHNLKLNYYTTLTQRLRSAQYTLYAVVGVAIIASIIVGALVALPYLAIPFAIGILGGVTAEIVRHKKIKLEQEMQTYQNLPQASSPNLANYIKSELEPAIQSIVEHTYSVFKKPVYAQLTPPQEKFIPEAKNDLRIYE